MLHFPSYQVNFNIDFFRAEQQNRNKNFLIAFSHHLSTLQDQDLQK